MLPDRRFYYRFLLLLPLVLLAGFCVFYLSNQYGTLASWYEALPGPFYRKAYWRSELFTPRVWQQGRLFCMLALFLIPVLGGTVFKIRFPEKQPWYRADWLAMGGVAVVALLLGTFNATITELAMDEDQSALFFGGAHPFRALSHYPVPNNHVLFNTLNALIATPETALLWGKIIAVLGYAGAGMVGYIWIKSQGVARRAAVFMALLCLTLFPVWGFSGQARSYSLYLLCCWWALLLVDRYWKSKDVRHLSWYPVAVAAGYGLLPTFLYFHVGLCFWGLWHCFSDRRVHFSFWITQAFAVAASFLVMLPLLGFSGLGSVAGHQWVTPMPWSAFSFPPFGPFRDYLTGYGALGYLLGILTALGAVSLFFGKQTRSLGALFCGLWLGCDLIVVLMRQTPFTRQLVGLYAVSFALALLAVYKILQVMAAHFHPKGLFKAAVVVGLALAAGMMITNRARLNDALYLYKIHETNSQIRKMLAQIPEGVPVGFTDNAFLPKALWQRWGKHVVAPEKALYLVQLEDVNPVAPTDSLVASYINIRVYKKQR